jgi:hypothetical protein
LKFTVSTVPFATVLPPESLVDLETSGVVPAAAAALENANISPAIAKTAESARRAPRSVLDRAVVLLVRVRPARSPTDMILAPHGLGARGTMRPADLNLSPARGRDVSPPCRPATARPDARQVTPVRRATPGRARINSAARFVVAPSGRQNRQLQDSGHSPVNVGVYRRERLL